MQPPRRRTPRFNVASTEALRGILLNVTAALTSILLLRFATLLVPNADDAAVPRYIQTLTAPLVWPFRQFPVLDNSLGRGVLVADAVVVALVFIAGLLAIGVLTGWRNSASRPVHQGDPYT